MPAFKQLCTPHSHPNSLDTGSTPEAFAKRQVELGGTTICATDHGSLNSAYQIYELGKKYNLIGIPGLEGYFRDDACPILADMGVERTTIVPRGSNKDEWAARYPNGTYIDYMKYMHTTIHAMDYEAYLCMVRLLSRADERAEQHGSERKPLFDWAAIEELASHNITMGSGCLIGMCQRHLIAHSSAEGAKRYFDRLHHLFGDRFFVEIFPNQTTHNWVKAVFIEVDGPGGKQTLQYYFGKTLRTDAADEIKAEALAEQPTKHKRLRAVKNFRTWDEFAEPLTIISIKKVEDFVRNDCSVMAPDGDLQFGANKYLRQLANKAGVPIIISDDSHLAYAADKVVQDVRLAQNGNWRFHESYNLKSSDEAWVYFKNVMHIGRAEFESWIDNSLRWADRFKGFKFDKSPRLPTKFYPEDTLSFLRKRIEENGRMAKDPRYLQRLRTEIDLIYANGLVDLIPYFATCDDVCDFHSRLGETNGVGRGSGAGCLVTYLLGITHLDPIKWDLSFDRFLTDIRVKSGKLPDLDLDFASRDPLLGGEMDVTEFQDENGVTHRVPAKLKLKTDKGLLTAEEAFAAGADIQSI